MQEGLARLCDDDVRKLRAPTGPGRFDCDRMVGAWCLRWMVFDYMEEAAGALAVGQLDMGRGVACAQGGA